MNCKEVCATDSITEVDGKANINVDSCINCMACEAECEQDAISENEDGVMSVNTEKCTLCS
jgi:Fe-S-cluster-containing hydrogenase component 2